MRLVDDPDERFEFPPAECRGCGAGLAGEEVAGQRRHQVTGIKPAPAPKVTEYVAQAKECPCWTPARRIAHSGMVTTLLSGMAARAVRSLRWHWLSRQARASHLQLKGPRYA